MYFDPMHCYTSGALAVGDAAGLADPLIGSGIGYALRVQRLQQGMLLNLFSEWIIPNALKGFDSTSPGNTKSLSITPDCSGIA
jgi:flavin-dependent dehydrogenase